MGLIGGSIARALREKVPGTHITAYDIHPETLQLAKESGIADTITFSIGEPFRDCDMIFLCAPVQKNADNLKQLKPLIKPDCLLTDVGSVKTDIHRAVQEADLEAQFIGGHPMAGSERTGFINSGALLLENAYYVLTPTASVPGEKVEAYRELVKTLGAIPLTMQCRQHDYVTAAISHLPHVVAASLVNLVRCRDSENGIMRLIAAGGFKDITRIASSSPDMWQQICLTNSENISGLLEDYISILSDFKEKIDTKKDSSLYELFDSARTYRESFIDASSGPIKRSFAITVDIADEPGALAAIATILALHQISIKNIGILHNREQEDGVLRLEFYDQESIEKARGILSGKGYVVGVR